MDINLKRLLQIITVARVGSISEAAEELHITQPALSRSIAVLEGQYGFKLFERGRGGASLTPIGESVIQEAEILLRQARSADHNFRLHSRGEAGEIAFGMGPLIASLILPTLGLHFIHHRPNLHFKAMAKSASVLYQALMEGSIEILFCAGGQLIDQPHIVFEDVGTINQAMIVRSGHPLTHLPSIDRDDISRYSVLSGAEMSLTQCGSGTGSFVCDNYHILKDMVLESDAVWISSPQLVVDEIRDGRLIPLVRSEPPLLPPTSTVCMISRKGYKLSPAAIAIQDYVRQHLSNVGWVERSDTQ